MIERYSRPEMAAIWTEQNKFEAYLKVEILACEAWAHLGHIPMEDVEKLWKNASFDLNRIYEIEQETRHDVVAFTRAVSETCGDEKKWVHYGLTSTDVVDTANGYLLKAMLIVPYSSFGSDNPICHLIAYFSSTLNFIYSVIIITDFSPCP